jgi:hypothetical protein
MKDRKEWDMELMNEFSLFNKDFSWGDEAACKGMPTDMFFPERGNSSSERAMPRFCNRQLHYLRYLGWYDIE